MHVQSSFNRFIQNFPRFSDPNFTWDKLGIKNIPTVPTYPTKLTPQVAVTGYNTILSSEFAGESSRQQLNFQANLSQTTGRHSLKYGFEWAQEIHHTRGSGRSRRLELRYGMEPALLRKAGGQPAGWQRCGRSVTGQHEQR